MRIIIAALLLICSMFSATAQTKPTILNHIAVHVYDLQRSTLFYKNILQLDSLPEPFHDGRHAWFRIGEHSQLHLIAGAKAGNAPSKQNHLCFTVASFEEFIDVLNKKGIAYEDLPGKQKAVTIRPDGVKQIYFQDPDGNWIEINNDSF